MKNQELLVTFLKKGKFSKKTKSSYNKLVIVISSLETLEEGGHYVAYEVVHKVMTDMKDKLDVLLKYK